MRRTRHTKIITAYTAAILLVLQLLAVSFCYGEEEFTYKAFRDDTMFLSMPESWQAEEVGDIDEDVEAVEDDELVYKALELKDQDGEKRGEMWICAEPYDDSYYYCDSEEDTEEYLDEVGDDAVETVFDEVFADAGGWTRSGSKYLRGEDAFVYVIRENVQVDDRKYLLYLSCDFTPNGGVHEVLLFEEPFDQKVCDRIGESMQAYSYAKELIDSRVQGEDSAGGDDSSGGSDDGSDGTTDGYSDWDDDSGISFDDVVSSLMSVVMIVIAAFVVRAVIRNRQQGGQRKRPGNRDASGSDLFAVLRSNQQDLHKAIDKWTLKEKRKGKCTHEDMHIQKGTRYSGYQESLRTLHKSGLLTTKEMNELLEKHKNDL